VALADRRAPKYVQDPLRFVLARIDEAQRRLNGKVPP
jgi:hypothetical protein